MNHDAPFANSTASERRTFWLFMLFALIILSVGMGLRDPWPSDEPRFTLAAQQMVESGDWLFPHRGVDLYSDKPPTLMWLEAISFEVTRTWRIAFLLPSLLAGLLTLGLTYDLGRRLWNPRAGLYAAGAVLFAFQFTYQVKRAQIDPLVTGWITLANWGLLLHCLRGPNWRAYWLGCFAAGLGVITKGVGVLALLMLLPYAFARLGHWHGVTQTAQSAWRWAAGGLAFLLPILAWAVPMVLVAEARDNPQYAAYVNDILFRQTAQRYANSWSHPQPFWYYLPIVLFNWFPLSLMYPAAVPRWWRDLKARESRVMLPLVWSLLVIVFFSIPVGKRDVYVMPVLPMVALAMAPYFADALRSRWLRSSAFAIALVGGIVIAAAGFWAMAGHVPAADRFIERRELDEAGHWVWGMVAAIGIGLLAGAAWFRIRRGVHGLLAGITILWLIWSFWAYPLLNASSSAAGIMQEARHVAGPDTEIGLVAWKEQNRLMLDGPVHDFGFKRPWSEQFVAAEAWLRQAPATRRLFILENAMGDCVNHGTAHFLGHANRRQWWLVAAGDVVPGCVPPDKHDADDDDDDDGS